MEYTNAQLLERLAAAEEENRVLKNHAPSFGLKVSEKRGLSVYGLGRFPVTLYKEQWKNLISRIPEIQSFIVAHDSELATKPVKSITA